MGQPFVGEIRMFGGNFAPNGWMLCQGQLLPISQNETLFILIGTTYGGDGQETFALPNLSGRIPIHQGQGVGGNHIIGQMDGVESVTLTTQQIPIHTHAAMAAATATGSTPVGAVPAGVSAGAHYYSGVPSAPVQMAASSPVGGSQPHDNMAPYLCINFIISLFGIFPQQN